MIALRKNKLSGNMYEFYFTKTALKDIPKLKATHKDNSAGNFNVIRQIAFNILKSKTSFKGGITDKQFKCLLDRSYLDKIITNWLCS